MAGLRGHEPYDSARARYNKRDDVQAVPEEIREFVTAQTLGMGLEELRETPWEDVEALMAYRRGREIATQDKRQWRQAGMPAPRRPE